MAVGGIDVSLVMDISMNPCKELCQDAVQVIYQHGSAHHLVCLSAVITKMPCNKTAFILENVVAQELRAHEHELYYYNSTKRGEVDFVVQNTLQGEILLVEVKSGKSYKRHVALKSLLAANDYKFSNAYVLCNSNVEVTVAVVYLPIYMACFL